MNKNELGQPIGAPVPGWAGVATPPRTAMRGMYCTVEPFDLDAHAAALHDANTLDAEGRNWTYLPYGPFDTLDAYRAWAASTCTGSDPFFHSVIDHSTGKPVGVASYLRIDPKHGAIEVGHINFSPLLQRSRASTEAMYLMMRRAFELGYRRYEWKCNALNMPSRSAAQRLGLSYEGVFRQNVIVKGLNRDTAWYAAIDSEWPRLRAAFERWLAPENFDAQGQQRFSLSALTRPVLVHIDDGWLGA
jgi:RimJ/RimL family protein N-acetyltransferase